MVREGETVEEGGALNGEEEGTVEEGGALNGVGGALNGMEEAFVEDKAFNRVGDLN